MEFQPCPPQPEASESPAAPHFQACPPSATAEALSESPLSGRKRTHCDQMTSSSQLSDPDSSSPSDAVRKPSAASAGRSREGENNSNHKIAEAQALEIWKRLQSGEKAPKCAEEFGISVHIVRSIKYGKRWTHITGLENRRKQQSSSPVMGTPRPSPTSVTAGPFVSSSPAGPATATATAAAAAAGLAAGEDGGSAHPGAVLSVPPGTCGDESRPDAFLASFSEAKKPKLVRCLIGSDTAAGTAEAGASGHRRTGVRSATGFEFDEMERDAITLLSSRFSSRSSSSSSSSAAVAPSSSSSLWCPAAVY